MKLTHGLMLVLSAIALGACPGPKKEPTPIGSPPPPPPDQPPPPPAGPVFDATGWTLLGSKDVDGKLDHDTIEVGRQEGRFDKIALVVTNSDLELLKFQITFNSGKNYEPEVRHYFKEGSRSRLIDLPPTMSGEGRFIKSVQVTYKNLPGGGRAHVDVYARGDKPTTTEPPPPPVKPGFDPTGWTLLGSSTVEGKKDKDVINVGKKAGRIDQITMVVKDSDLELMSFIVTFGNGKKFDPKVRHAFKEDSRTRVIDLPGADRFIKSIALKYSNLPGGGKASVEIYGKDTAQESANKGRQAAGFDTNGWALLGGSTIEGKKDKDLIKVGKAAGRIDQITMLVMDSDLELDSMTVTFGNGKKMTPEVRHSFKEGSRTRVIDLPGADRFIKTIAVKYTNTPGTGKARVEFWGKDTGQGAAPGEPKEPKEPKPPKAPKAPKAPAKPPAEKTTP